MTYLKDLDFGDDLALKSQRIQGMRDKTKALEGTRCQCRPEDQCDKDKTDAYRYQR